MQMRATSQNRKGAMLVGIDVERIDVISFGLGCALAAAAGTLWVVSGQVFNPYMGSIPAVKAFAIIILGGLGSIPGAIIGGLLMGLAENGAAYSPWGHLEGRDLVCHPYHRARRKADRVVRGEGGVRNYAC